MTMNAGFYLVHYVTIVKGSHGKKKKFGCMITNEVMLVAAMYS